MTDQQMEDSLKIQIRLRQRLSALKDQLKKVSNPTRILETFLIEQLAELEVKTINRRQSTRRSKNRWTGWSNGRRKGDKVK